MRNIHLVHEEHPRSTRQTLIKYMCYIHGAHSKQVRRKVWCLLLVILPQSHPSPMSNLSIEQSNKKYAVQSLTKKISVSCMQFVSYM